MASDKVKEYVDNDGILPEDRPMIGAYQMGKGTREGEVVKTGTRAKVSAKGFEKGYMKVQAYDNNPSKDQEQGR